MQTSQHFLFIIGQRLGSPSHTCCVIISILLHRKLKRLKAAECVICDFGVAWTLSGYAERLLLQVCINFGQETLTVATELFKRRLFAARLRVFRKPKNMCSLPHQGGCKVRWGHDKLVIRQFYHVMIAKSPGRGASKRTTGRSKSPDCSGLTGPHAPADARERATLLAGWCSTADKHDRE